MIAFSFYLTFLAFFLAYFGIFVTGLECLPVSGEFASNLQLVTPNKTSLLLRFDPWQPRPSCQHTSHPSTLFTIHYRAVDSTSDDVSCADASTSCDVIATYERHVTLAGLRPFTKYLVQVSASNYFNDVMQSDPVFDTSKIFTTVHGGM